MSFQASDVERKVLSILKVLHTLQEPTGSRMISKHLKEYGFALSERAVRYHLKLTDQRGLTQLVGNLDGRIITQKGINEIKSALVKDKVGFAISRIEQLAYRTNFDYRNRSGTVPVNISLFRKPAFSKALSKMKPAFESGLCVSHLVVVADSGQRIGDVIIPDNRVGLATVCSIIVNGVLLKAGIPTDSRFAGLLEIQNHKPSRFTEIIHYSGCSLDPSEIFIRAKMTSVKEAAITGSGEILANFREIPAICLPVFERVLDGLKSSGLGGVFVRGNTSETVCEVPIEPNKIGLILIGGLNPVAAAQEAGIEAENHSMSTVVEYKDLVNLSEIK